MRWLHQRPLPTTLLATMVALGAVVIIAALRGFGHFFRAWSHTHVQWLALVVVAELAAVPAYSIAYRALARAEDGHPMPLPLIIRVVAMGFGPHAVYGGFELDQRALCAMLGDSDAATIQVLGLGALEWALLAPAACLTAAGLLVVSDQRPMASILWPWVVAVPVGFALGLGLSHPAITRRVRDRQGRGWAVLGKVLSGVGVLHVLARAGRRASVAWLGMAVYWALDIAAFYGAVRLIGLQPNVGEAIVAYATGYALTRRALPLGGAGVTEALMTFSLHWVGQPVIGSLAAVVVYRAFNFALPALLAVFVRRRIGPLLQAGEQGRAPTEREREQAEAPLVRLPW